MKTFTYTRWSGSKKKVTADNVEFTATHVVFRDAEGHVLLAERQEQVNELREQW